VSHADEDTMVRLLASDQAVAKSDVDEDRPGELGFEQYAGPVLFDVDLRYGLVGSEPSNLGLFIGVSLKGP